jgi:isocitrate dehydrogenase (NAD+)
MPPCAYSRRCGLGFSYDFVDAGLAAQQKFGELLPQATLDAISRHRVALKSPLTTPVGEGFSSINVQLRRQFDLYANVRPAISFPNTRSRFPENVDLITVRENTEGAYAGEGQQVSEDGATATLVQKITRRGSERIVRYAFDLARREGRKKVTVVHKANILKSTSGLFLKVAREVAAQYPEIQCNEMIVDNTCMQLVMRPEQFDVIVTTNLFGDIISDLCAGLVGGLGLAPGANIGAGCGDFRSRARLGAGHRRQGHRQSLCAAARCRADARPSQSPGRGCASAQGDPRRAGRARPRHARPRRNRHHAVLRRRADFAAGRMTMLRPVSGRGLAGACAPQRTPR